MSKISEESIFLNSLPLSACYIFFLHWLTLPPSGRHHFLRVSVGPLNFTAIYKQAHCGSLITTFFIPYSIYLFTVFANRLWAPSRAGNMAILHSVGFPVLSTLPDITQVLKYHVDEWIRSIHGDGTLVPCRSGRRLWTYIKSHHKTSLPNLFFYLLQGELLRTWVNTSNILFMRSLRDDFSVIPKILISPTVFTSWALCIMYLVFSLFVLTVLILCTNFRHSFILFICACPFPYFLT